MITYGMPLFKVKINYKSYYFLTRGEAKEFIEANENAKIDDIEIEESKNEELSNLIQSIKENF